MIDIPKTAEGDRSAVSSKESRQTEQKEEDKTVDEEDEDEEKTTSKEEEEAATRIQAAFRGHHARKSMKDTETSTKQTESKSDSEPTKEQLLQEFREDDKGELFSSLSVLFSSLSPFFYHFPSIFPFFLLFLPFPPFSPLGTYIFKKSEMHAIK